jgi:hypothetical protein
MWSFKTCTYEASRGININLKVARIQLQVFYTWTFRTDAHRDPRHKTYSCHRTTSWPPGKALVPACMHTHKHAYTHATCIHTCIHTYIHKCCQTCIHTYIHTYTHTSMQHRRAAPLPARKALVPGCGRGYDVIHAHIYTYMHYTHSYQPCCSTTSSQSARAWVR